jgi:hypothetical protein
LTNYRRCNPLQRHSLQIRILQSGPCSPDPSPTTSNGVCIYLLLQLCNLINMFQIHRFPDGLPRRIWTPLFHTSTLQQEPRSRRTLDYKTKRPRRPLDKHFYLHRRAGFIMGGAGIEFFAEVNGLEASGAEDWTDRGGRRSLTCWAEKFN